MPEFRHSIGKRIGHTFIKKLVRMPSGEGRFFFKFDGLGDGRSRSSFLDSEDVPPFEGDEAWFEVEKVSAKPWPFWRAIRQVDPPAPEQRHARTE